MNPKLLAAALVAALTGIVILAVVLAGGGDDAGGQTAVASPTATATTPGDPSPTRTASPTATLETAPDVTPTPSSPEEQARSLKLVEAPAGLLQWVDSGPYVVPADAFGMFYVNIETQRFEGWHALVERTRPIGVSGDNRFTVFELREQVSQGGTVYPARRYLADRETRKVYFWEGPADLVWEEVAYPIGQIASRGGLVLFRVPAKDDDWFALLDVAKNEVVQTFQATAQWALISRDATKVALVRPDVLVADLETGEVERIAQDVLEQVDLEGSVELIERPDGASFLVVTNPAKFKYRGIALHYAWDGTPLGEITGAKLFPSPTGEVIAAAEPVVAPEEESGPAPWYVFNVFTTRDGSEVFRVVGVLHDYGRNAGNRWLADGSGLVVQRPPYSLMLAMRDGSFREFVGVPSPDSPDVFAQVGSQGLGVFGPDGTPLLTLSFLGGAWDPFDPWGDRGDEVRVLVPHGGHGGPGLVAAIVEPYVEQAPYQDSVPSLQLSQAAVAFGLLDLYDEPGGAVVGRVEAPYRVTVHEVATRCSGESMSDPERCPLIDDAIHASFLALVSGAEVQDAGLTGLWARVSTPQGQEGWLLMQVTRQGL